MDSSKKNYTTFEDYYRLLGNEPMTDEEFEKMMLPTNDDLSIEEITVETMKETQTILMRSLEKLDDDKREV